MLSQPSNRGIVRPLVRSIAGSPFHQYDTDAQARILQIETAKGSPMSLTQRMALDTFIRQEKSSGRWSSHKRIYLPIWANAAANAIDLITGTSGTWVNSPTHAHGYVQGNGTTQYFDTGTSPASVGITNMAGYLFGGVRAPMTGGLLGSINTFIDSAGGTRSRYGDIIQTVAAQSGIILASQLAGSHSIHRRGSASFTTSLSLSATTPTASYAGPFTCMSRNNSTDSANPVYYSADQQFMWGFGSGGLSTSAAESFSLNLKNLWETLTSLTLPA
ncbi:MAG: hypothetical protein EOP85_02050 [Verrucomicrobiaceae bacterium]|nr:MAG: hypothetical protein EOP85_02050 [Verrucomicrobiaceae bacterium]